MTSRVGEADAYTDVHEVLVYLTISREDLTTTPEHPFLQTDGQWTPAGELAIGSKIQPLLYTNDGQPDLVTDPRGSVTDYVYDPQGRLKNVIAGTVAVGTAPALNQTITYTYDVNGRVRVVTDGRNQAHTLSYDAFGRLEWEQDPLGNRLTYSYDKLDRLEGQVIGSNNPAQAVTTRYTYDAAGRRTTMRVDPNGLNLTTVYSYTQPGSSDTWNLQQVRDPKGHVTNYGYNSLGLRATTTDALAHTWVFDYDNLGRLTRQTDPLGHFVEYLVDGLGRTEELRQEGRVEKWAFRPDGALDTYTDFAGRVTTFAYDPDQLLTAIDYPAGMADVGYGYDAAGNVTSVSDGLGGASYSYDVLNRLDTRTRNGRIMDYGYSATNQVTSIDYWGRGSVGYGYDNAGRLTSLTPWGGAATSYSYRSSGQLAGISRPNTVATTYSYDTAGRLTGLHHVQGGATTLNNIVYGLDNNGNRDWMTDNDGLTDYVYDALNRLDTVTYPAIPGGPPAATIDYSMDAVGNRTGDGTTTYSHDASDRITNAGFVYDTNGNLLSDGVKSYEYDAANRLTKVISGSVTIDYAYDGWGNLIQESSNGVTTEFVLDERGALPTILGEVRSDGAERLYAYGPEGFAAQMTVGGGVEYPLLDGLGSLRQLTDNNGAIVLYRSYDAFGTIGGSGGTSSSRLGYTGELQDTATGLVYLRARHYHPVLGRFLQRDSFAGFQHRPQSLNRYSYTENNPVNMTDPSGHIANWLIGAGIGFGLGSALYLINEQSQDGIDLGIDIAWDGWVPTCVNFNDWGDLMAAGLLGAAAGAMIATPGAATIGASMAGNLLSDHWSNVRNGQDFSWRRHGWNGAVGAFSGLLTGVFGELLKAYPVIAVPVKGAIGAGLDTYGDYNTFFGLEPVTGEMMLTNLLFNLGGETFGELMGRAGRFAARGGWTDPTGDLWDGIMTQYWKYFEGPAKDLIDYLTS
ncbi:MAG: hypothetical protein DYG89_50250 [Caldilinea sp. CFX5]|nr:hypothetical protein [Caldilinea sp. CFX5]